MITSEEIRLMTEHMVANRIAAALDALEAGDEERARTLLIQARRLIIKGA